MAHVMVIDDDPNFLDILEVTLSKCGYTIEKVTTIAEATAACANRKPDAVLLDIHLGGEDGSSFLSTNMSLSAKTIVLTNDDSPETIAQYVTAGISDYLLKSNLNIEKVRTLVEKKIAL
jgi:DNA-binding response OmpR family regulator